MKKFFPIVLIFVFLGLLLSCGKEEVQIPPESPVYQLAKDLSAKIPALDPGKNQVVVTSKDFKIRVGDVLENMRLNFGPRMAQLKNLPPEQLKSIFNRNAESLGEKKLFLNAAAKANIQIPATEVDSILQMQYARAGGEEKFKEMLTQAQVSLEDLTRNIRESLTIQKYLDAEMNKKIQITDEEIQKAYQEDKTATVRHILLLTQGKTEAEKQEIRKRMEEILKRARAGEDFAELAKKYSEDPGSRDRGGLYENFGHGQMVKPFEDAAFSVPIGQISDIIETRYGYHILKVIDRKKETRPLKEVRGEIEKRLRKDKEREVYTNLIERLKKEANFQMTEI